MTVVTAAGLGLVTLGAPVAPADPTRRSAGELKALADEAGRALEGAPAEEIARWATGTSTSSPAGSGSGRTWPWCCARGRTTCCSTSR